MATNYVRVKYQEIIDLHTESDTVTAIGIHTPTGDTPRRMFPGLFDQFKKYKYRGASVRFVPVATLPADPLQISYEAGEPNTIDPRDLANPILVHGCHGNDMGTILNRLYGDGDAISNGMDGITAENFPFTNINVWKDTMERLYYKGLTDVTWKKAHPQRGFVKGNLRPLIYSLAANRQIMSGSLADDLSVDSGTGDLHLQGGDPLMEFVAGTGDNVNKIYSNIDKTGIQFFTPRLTRLGWMDTRNVITRTVATDKLPDNADQDDINALVNAIAIGQINYAELPKIFMLMIMLPPAYKQEMYFRAIITHHFAFKDFRGISFMPEVTGVPSYYNANSDMYDPDTYPEVPGLDPLEGA